MPLTKADYSKRWREKYPDKERYYHHKYYTENKERETKRQQLKYIWNKERTKFLNILL